MTEGLKALTADQMVSALNQVFEKLGEIDVKGNQAQLFLNIRLAVAQVNNSLVHYIQEAAVKTNPAVSEKAELRLAEAPGIA